MRKIGHEPLPFGHSNVRTVPRWQHRRQFVANTRWWPPFCLVVDWVAAAVLVVLLAIGVDFHH